MWYVCLPPYFKNYWRGIFGNVTWNTWLSRLGAVAGEIGIRADTTTHLYAPCRGAWFGELTDKWWLRGHEIGWWQEVTAYMHIYIYIQLGRGVHRTILWLEARVGLRSSVFALIDSYRLFETPCKSHFRGQTVQDGIDRLSRNVGN